MTSNVPINPIIILHMMSGQKIKIELYPQIAPNTVSNFIHLCKKGFYNGLIFHRIIPGFMIQGGDPTGTGTGGPGYSISGEFKFNGVENNLKHTLGVVSMARSSHPDSAGSQFFIMVADAPSLDGQYAAFGKVIQGLDAALEIAKQPRDAKDRPLKPQTIRNVTIDTYLGTYPEPKKSSLR